MPVSSLQKRILTLYAPVLGMALVMLYYAWFHYQYALNVPYGDDIHDVLQFVGEVARSNTWADAFQSFFAQNNEHRTLSSRLVYYTAFFVEGEVNFRTLVFLANLALPLLLLTLYVAVRGHAYTALILLPVVFLLFQFRTYESSFWGMAAFGLFCVYAYGFASLVCLREVRAIRFLAAILFATLATFTLASGQLVWLVGLASLVHQAFILRRCSWVYPISWIVATVAILLVWRFDYTSANSLSHLLSMALDSPLHVLVFFFALLGSAISGDNIALAVTLGAGMVCVVIVSSLRSVTREDISLELLAWYVILSVMAMALGRAPVLELELALTSRYSFPSLLLLATLTALMTSRLPVNRTGLSIHAVVVFLALSCWIFSFQTYRPDLQRELEMRVRHFNAQHYWNFGYPVKETGALVNEAIVEGIYRPPQRPLPLPDITEPSKAKKLSRRFRTVE